MMGENSKPSIDPANEGSLEGVLRHVLKKAIQNVDGMLPAKVIAYDRQKNSATVQPLVMVQGTDGQKLSRASIASLPVFRYGAGNALLSFPVQAGDIGWVFAGDRDISLSRQGDYGEEAPNTDRMHSFENGMFFPDSAISGGIEAEDLNKTVLGNRDGSVKITFDGSELKIKASVKVTVESPDVVIKASTKVKIESPEVEMTGNLTVQGAATIIGTTSTAAIAATGAGGAGASTFQGDIAATGTVSSGSGLEAPEAQIGSITFTTHTHGGVQPGGGNTGAPQ